MIALAGVSKSFVLHNQGGAVIPVMAEAARARERICDREEDVSVFTLRAAA